MVDKDTFLDLFINSLEKKMKEMMSLFLVYKSVYFLTSCKRKWYQFSNIKKTNKQ